MVLASCGGSESTTNAVGATTSADSPAADGAGLRLVSAEDAAGIIASQPEDLVILDVRTPEEFAEGHIEGAIMLDFYRDDFADELAKLDPSVPYVLYCRSGNRSGQTISLMEGLGFADVADVDGGIGGWLGAGLPVVAP
jgi:rhodanese-related sulfurtransferase